MRQKFSSKANNLAKVGVVGSNPIARSKIPPWDQRLRVGSLRRAFLVLGLRNQGGTERMRS